MPDLVPQATTSQPRLPTTATANQFSLALDHPRLNGLLPSERQTAITALARLMLEARGMGAATREDGHDHD